MELTADWVVASTSSFLCAVVRIETSSATRATTALSLSKEAKLLMQNRKSNGARTEP